MRSRVYVTVERPSVLPPVCPIDRQLTEPAPPVPAAGELNSNGAAARRSAANAGSHVDSRGTRLNRLVVFLKNFHYFYFVRILALDQTG